MNLALLLLIQSAAITTTAPETAQPSASPPDIEIVGQIRARSVAIEREEPSSIVLHAEPSADEPRVIVERSAPGGDAEYEDLEIRLHAEARIDNALAPPARRSPPYEAPPVSTPDVSQPNLEETPE